MELYVWGSVWTLHVICLFKFVTSASTPDSEKVANGVDISLYMISLDNWKSDGVKTSFESTVVSEANSMCASAPLFCGLSAWNTTSVFTEGHIEYSINPVYTKPNLNLKYLLSLPGGATRHPSHPQYYLRKTALIRVSESSRTSLKSAAIAAIDGTNLGPVPEVAINAAVSVTALVIVLVLLFILLILRAKCEEDYSEYLTIFPRKHSSSAKIGIMKDAENGLKVKPDFSMEDSFEEHELYSREATEIKTGPPIIYVSTEPKPVMAVQEVKKLDDDPNGHVEAPPTTVMVSEPNQQTEDNEKKF